jgi:hypothetical protein
MYRHLHFALAEANGAVVVFAYNAPLALQVLTTVGSGRVEPDCALFSGCAAITHFVGFSE